MEEAKNILNGSGLRIIAASDLDDAAKKACSVAKIVGMAKEASLDVFYLQLLWLTAHVRLRSVLSFPYEFKVASLQLQMEK